MSKRIPMIHIVAVCENPKTRKRVICDIYEQEGKVTIEYNDKSYPANMYAQDLQKAISIVFK